MDCKDVITSILNGDDEKNNKSYIDENISEVRAEIEKCLSKFVIECREHKKQNSAFVVRLLYMAVYLKTDSFDMLFSLIDSDKNLILYEDTDFGINSDYFASFLAQIIAFSDDSELREKKLSNVFYNQNCSSWNREVAFYTLFLLYSTLPEVADCDNKLKINEKKKKNLCLEVIKYIESHISKEVVFEFYDIIERICDYCLEKEYVRTVETEFSLWMPLRSLLTKILIESGIDHNCSVQSNYFRRLTIFDPREICRAKDIASNIRKWKLEEKDIFVCKDMQEVGRRLLYSAIGEVEGATIDTAKLAIQLLHKYPLNSRKAPVTNEEYYDELCAILEINKLPHERYQRAIELYEETKNKYVNLIGKIDSLIDKCRGEISSIKNDIYNIDLQHNSQNSRFEDTSDDEKKRLTLLQKQKIVESLYREENMTNPDGYLVFCKEELQKTFKMLIDEEDEVETILGKWTIRDVREAEVDEQHAFNSIEESFSPYLRIIEQFNEIILENPYDTIRFMSYRIRWIPFANFIRDDFKKKYGYEFLQENSEHHSEYMDEINNHPLNCDYVMRLNDGSEYLDRLESSLPKALEMIRNTLDDSVCFKTRKDLIENIINLVEDRKYKLASNVIPVQIEGLFVDYLENSTIYAERGNLKKYTSIFYQELMKKTALVQEHNLNLGFDCIGYFRYYFNHVIRNTVSHGNFELLSYSRNDSWVLHKEDVEKAIAIELVLDLNFLIGAIYNSNEVDEARRYIEETAQTLRNGGEYKYERLMADFIKEQRYNERSYVNGIFAFYEPEQLLSWIYNPRYEEFVDSEMLTDVRDAIESRYFWDYVIDNVHFYDKDKEQEFKQIVTGLFTLFKSRNAMEAVDKLKELNRLLGEN